MVGHTPSQYKWGCTKDLLLAHFFPVAMYILNGVVCNHFLQATLLRWTIQGMSADIGQTEVTVSSNGSREVMIVDSENIKLNHVGNFNARV